MHITMIKIFDALLDGCVIFSKDLTITYMNHSACMHARGTLEQYKNKPWAESAPNVEKTNLYRAVCECFKTRETKSIENQYFYPDGTYSWFSQKLYYSKEEVVVLSSDITALKQLELEQKKYIKRIEALRDIDLSIINMNDITITLETIAKRVISVLEVDAATLILFDVNGHPEYFVGEGLEQRALDKDNLLLDQGYLYRVAQNDETIIDNNILENKNLLGQKTLTQIEQFSSYVATPLRAMDRTIGIIELLSKKSLTVDSTWISCIETFSEQVGLAIKYSRMLKEINNKNIALELSYDKTIEGWSKALELKDNETKGHTVRVADLAERLGRRAGFSESRVKYVRWGALLHDIGKIGVPDSILNKPGALTLEERAVMMKHPVFAKELLDQIDYLKPCIDIPYCHHERFDGLGYPQGLAGDKIPLEARLFSVIDVWDALSSDRPYRKAWDREQIVPYLLSMKGKQFDPYVVDLFLEELSSSSCSINHS